MENNSEYVLKMLTASNKKDVERETGIPADRIYKWLKGKGNPKVADLEILTKYFQNGKNSNGNENVTKGEQRVFNDIGKLNSQNPYLENITFPLDSKAMPIANDYRGEQPQWRQLYNIQQEEINLLHRKIELLNQLIQQ